MLRLVNPFSPTLRRSLYSSRFGCSTTSRLPCHLPPAQRTLVSRMSSSVPKTTKAVQYTKVGGPEVIELAEVETATPKPDEILVKIEWAGVNFSS